ncbi:nuclear transport factor 2 family protein [Nocardia alni]|uniref:nuclear transport factor 2 family protein n=1 Tax=Nocardia alni TaxID=2815723 RepID=UPI001C224029|nr:nuclear transport factor 2 family protein [Nocardia alni]
MSENTPPQTPAEIVRAFYDAITAQDPQRLAELAETSFAEDITLDAPPSLPYGGTVRGAHRLSRMFQGMARGPADIGPRNLRMESIVAERDTVVARLAFDYRSPAGSDIASGALEEWAFTDGRAVTIRAYYWDTAALA